MFETNILETVIRCILALGCLYLPGAAVIAWFPMRNRNFPERLAAGFGLGIAIIALAALLGRVLAFEYSAVAVIVVESICALMYFAGRFRNRKTAHSGIPDYLPRVVLAGIVVLRFFQARGLVFPPWVDSVHHAFIIRVFLERGGLPADLAPWLPIPFYYHYAFHSAAAVFAVFSGLAPDAVLLVFGQILNAMAALSVYRLSMALHRDPRRALLAMALAGFVTQMPAFYLAWGRYTLLAGMVLLPLAMAEAVEYAHRAPRRAGLVRLAILTAGVLLAHYLAGLLLALFLVLLGCWVLLRRNRRPRIVALAGATLTGAVLALPWLIPMLRNAAPDISLNLVTPSDPVDAVYFTDYTVYLWKLLGPLRNYLVVGLGSFAALAALFRRGSMRVFALWGLLLGLQALPWGLHIAPFRPDHMVIVLFLPLAVLLADRFVALAEYLQRRKPAWNPRVWLGIAAAAFCVYGIWDTRTIVKPSTVFADSADREAVLWAARNTPEESLFLINVTSWQNGLYRGVDGGWWLLPLAGRRTLLPPMIYSFAQRDYVDAIVRVSEQTSRLDGCTPEFWSLVEANGIDFVYAREDVGTLKPSVLSSCKGLERVFGGEKVSIYKISSGG
jgi:hypothetical protein